jgi:hypothetical protein
MKQLLKLVSVLALLLVGSSELAQAAPLGTCEARLPQSLRQSLHEKYPAYRVAEVSDYPKEDIDLHKKNFDGDPCLSVASGDVDGDGSLDFAVLITDKSRHTLLIAARNVAGEEWAIAELSDFGNEGPSNSYVDPLPADSYDDMYATDKGPSDYVPEPGRVKRYKAVHPGFIAGTIEASGVGYFFTGKRWVHLWLSD